MRFRLPKNAFPVQAYSYSLDMQADMKGLGFFFANEFAWLPFQCLFLVARQP